MLDLEKLTISGLAWETNLLWIAAPEERLVATYNPQSGKAEVKLSYPYEIWDVCPHTEGLWLMTGGGRLGRQFVLWSLDEKKELRKFNCPDGAGAGMTLFDGKLWVSHPHNRKLFCMDPENGTAKWIIRTEHETFSLAAYRNELWLMESDPGPLGHWSRTEQAKYFFSRYDPAQEKTVERLVVPFSPLCMAFDGKLFWYVEQGTGRIAWDWKADLKKAVNTSRA